MTKDHQHGEKKKRSTTPYSLSYESASKCPKEIFATKVKVLIVCLATDVPTDMGTCYKMVALKILKCTAQHKHDQLLN